MFRQLNTSFGFENMGVVADVLIQRFLAIIEEYAPLRKRLRPYQTLVVAVDKNEKFGFSTVGLLTGLHSANAVSQAVALFYEQNPDVVLPHSGTIFDMGRTLTHKRAAVLLKHQGLLEQEIARRINHHPSAVARYNNDDERVGQLWEEGKSAEMISFITGLSMKVVQEYIAIRQELRQEAKRET